MSAKSKFNYAGDVLSRLFSRLLPKDLTGFSHFVSGWERLVGPELAMHVYPKDIDNHTIILETDHPGWSQQIKWQQEKIIKVLNKKYPELEIQRVRVVVDDGSRSRISRQDVYESKKEYSHADTAAVPLTEDDQPFFDLLETMRRRGGT